MLRRIMRRALRHGKMLGIEEPFLYRTSGKVIELMQEAYPELRETEVLVSRVIRNEEERFAETLGAGMKLLREELEKMRKGKTKVLSGDMAFRLYDTFGFPLDLTGEILQEEGLTLDEEGFRCPDGAATAKEPTVLAGDRRGKDKRDLSATRG